MSRKTLRLLFPQWQGGNNPPYHLGSLLLSFLAPRPTGPVEEVPVALPDGIPLAEVDGIRGKAQILRQLNDAAGLIEKHNPEAIVVLGGDCLVSLAPFAHLLNQYGNSWACYGLTLIPTSRRRRSTLMPMRMCWERYWGRAIMT